MDFLTSPIDNVFGLLGEDIIVSNVKTKGVISKANIKNESSDYIFEEKTTLFVLDSVEAKVGDSVIYRSKKMKISSIKNERGYKKLGLRCVKEPKFETISL